MGCRWYVSSKIKFKTPRISMHHFLKKNQLYNPDSGLIWKAGPTVRLLSLAFDPKHRGKLCIFRNVAERFRKTQSIKSGERLALWPSDFLYVWVPRKDSSPRLMTCIPHEPHLIVVFCVWERILSALGGAQTTGWGQVNSYHHLWKTGNESEIKCVLYFCWAAGPTGRNYRPGANCSIRSVPKALCFLTFSP